jgi:hypothetical protein
VKFTFFLSQSRRTAEQKQKLGDFAPWREPNFIHDSNTLLCIENLPNVIMQTAGLLQLDV